VYIIGGGNSLRGFDFNRLRNSTVLAVNDAARYLPWATALFSLDHRWIKNQRKEIETFKGEKYLAVGESFDFDVAPEAIYLRREHGKGFSINPERIYMGGGNSGFGAVNVALLQQSLRIILLGFDFCKHAGALHWHGEYPWAGGFTSVMWAKWAQLLDDQASFLKRKGVEVYNASDVSLLNQYTRVPLTALPLKPL
jgi:hypothetical protein